MSTSPSSQSSQPTNQAVPTAHVPTEGLVSPDRVPVRRALISVYDKTGLEELATGLHAAGVQIVSTGSTAQRIAAELQVEVVAGHRPHHRAVGEVVAVENISRV